MIPVKAGRGRGVPLATWLLLAVNVAVYVYASILNPGAFRLLVSRYAFIPYSFLQGERVYSIVTSMFIHAGFLHLAGNMLYLYVFGGGVEAKLGGLRFLAFYLTVGVLASLIHLAIQLYPSATMLAYSPLHTHLALDRLKAPCIGASGAISGVLGAYLYLYPRSRVSVLMPTFFWLPMVVPIPALLFIGVWFAYQLWMGLTNLALGIFTGVAFWAHVGGFIAGLALVNSFKPSRLLA